MMCAVSKEDCRSNLVGIEINDMCWEFSETRLDKVLGVVRAMFEGLGGLLFQSFAGFACCTVLGNECSACFSAIF